MKVRLMPLIAICLFAGSLAWTRQDRGYSDPPPTAHKYPGPSSNTTQKRSDENQQTRSGIFPDPPLLDERHIWQELQGYAVGAATHRDGLLFSERLAGEIKTQIASGRTVRRIVVTGFADGIHNSGLSCDLMKLPVRCQAGISVPLDDDELALLRGCVILDQISNALGSQSGGGISWKGDEEDVPDGGNQGNPYRKTKVDVYMR
jgi:hypothetical protein